ncbi:uncharacterized protein LOC116172865 [Photinus pyralis]|uniref:uncharacterized protein LOC116172865 n=1 Tax=Photinus pyralis TaxID=7054 RepID=UPI001267511C|nr:uncharacterized protein LOC116172865 [Photinus pyralis]
MNFVFIFLCLVAVSKQQGVKDLNPALLDKIESITDDCLTESKAKEDEVIKMLDNGEFSGSQELKCFLKCIYVKLGVMNDAGEVQENGIKSQIPPGFDQGKASALIEKCREIHAGDPCETAFDVGKCIMEGLK